MPHNPPGQKFSEILKESEKMSTKKTALHRCLVLVLSLMIIMSSFIQIPMTASADSEGTGGTSGSEETPVYKYPFQNPALSADERVDDLISRLTLDEKIGLLHQFSGAIIRLGIPQFRTGTEGLHGLSWLGYATVFPQNTGLAMTWDKELMKKAGGVVGDEARAYNSVDARFNGIDVWAPVIDLARDPRSGRASESMGEDAYLAGMLSTNYALGMRGSDDFYYKTIPTLKHFAGYGQEASRTSYSTNASPRNLYEYYFKAFKYGIASGAVNSMMTSYNLINGKPVMTMPEVMSDMYGKWIDGGFENGAFFAVTDAGSPGNLSSNSANAYYPNSTLGQAAAMADSIKNGIAALTPSDTDTPTTRRWIYEAIARGMLTEADIDKAIHGVLLVRCHAGDLDADPVNPYKQLNKENALTTAENSQIAAQAAREQVVLLKNQGGILPLSKSLRKVAVSGPLGDENSTDFYAGTYPYTTYIKDRIQGKLTRGANALSFTRGIDVIALQVTGGTTDVDGKYIIVNADEDEDDNNDNNDNNDNVPLIAAGASPTDMRAQFYHYDYGYNNMLLRSAYNDKYLTASGPSNTVVPNGRAPGYETANRASQEWGTNQNFGFVGVSGDTVSLRFVKGTGVTSPTAAANVYVNSNAPYNVQHNGNNSPNSKFKIVTVTDGVADAVSKATGADVAIVCVGDQPHLTSRETNDRNNGDDNIKLAQDQQELIDAVSAVNPNTVVVIVGSYPFDIRTTKDNPNVKAIVYTSHAGQELGTAVADVLFGDYAPAGRLNQTWYPGLDPLPPITDYDIIKGERTYQYYDGEVLYPFGYGLTYTTFDYSNLTITPTSAANTAEQDITVSLTLKNTGTIASDEVVQLYTKYKHPQDSKVQHPLKTLNGFERIHLGAGQETQVTFHVKLSELAIWDVSRSMYYVDPGVYTFMVGRSSADEDIEVSSDMLVTGAPIPARDLGVVTEALNFDDYSFTDATPTGLRADIIPISVMEDDTYGIQARKAGGWVEYKNVDVSPAPQGITLRASNSNAAAADVEVWVNGPSAGEGGTKVGTVSVPATGHLQTFVNVGASLSGLTGNSADLYLVFPTANVGVKWLKLGAVTPAAGTDLDITSNYYNSNAATSLSRLHIKLDPVISQKGGRLLMEAMVNGTGTVNGAVTWSVTGADGSPTTLATIDGSGVLTATGTSNGTVRAVATYETSAGTISAYKLVELKNQDVNANVNAEAIIIRSGWDSRPPDISWGPNQFTNFGAIYQKNGTLTLSAVTYPFVNPARDVTFTLTDAAGTPTNLATIESTAKGFVEGQTSGDNNRAYNCTIKATGKGDGEVYLTATTTNGLSYTTKIIIQNQLTRNPYERYEAELFDASGNISGVASNIRADNVHGDDVGLQLNRIRNGDYAVYNSMDFGTSTTLNMKFKYLKVSSEPAKVKVMLNSPVEGVETTTDAGIGIKLGELDLSGDLAGDYNILSASNPATNEYYNVVYNWREASIPLNGSVSGVHDVYLVFDVSPNVPNTDISSTYGAVAGWLDLGINWFSFEAASAGLAPVSNAAVTAGDGQLILSWTDPADADFDHVVITGDGIAAPVTVAKGVQRAILSGLENGNSYTFTITAVGSAGNESAGVTVTGTPEPDVTTPAEVTNASVIPGDGRLTITWNDPADVDFDHVLVTTGSGITLATVGKGVQNAVITDLTNDVEYTFTISTVDTTGNISSGITVTGTPSAGIEPDTTPPAEVTNASVTAGDGQLTLTWTDPPDADLDYVAITTEGAVTLATVDKGVQTAVIGGLTNGIEYTFTISTVDLAGNISSGVTVTGTPSAATPPVTHTIYATAGSNGTITPSGTITVEDGTDKTFTFAPNSGYRVEAVVVDGVSVVAESEYTFVNITGDHTISVTFTRESSGNSGSSGSSTTTPPANTPKVESGKIELPAPAVTNGTAKAGISEDTFSKALGSAAADENGKKTVILNIPAASGAKEYMLELPAAALTSGADNTKVNIVTEWGRIEVPGNMLGNAQIQASTVSLSIGKADKSGLKPEVAEQVGDRPVIELNAFAGSSRLSWSNSEAPVTVSMKYVPKNDEELLNNEFITIWYIDGEGNPVPVTNARYDAKTGEVTFTVTHFSKYAVVYSPKTFGDLEGFSWAKHSIEVMASKGAIYGTSSDAFSPAASITRADFLNFVIATLDLKADFTENFTDVSKDANYYNAVGIGKKLGIVSGVGNGKFDPTAQITRQDLMVMAAKALKLAKGLEDGTSADLAGYADADKVRSSAQPSVAALIKAGIIAGANGRIDPLSSTTRAQAAVIMYNLYNK
jgi:beta-glucosidase